MNTIEVAENLSQKQPRKWKIGLLITVGVVLIGLLSCLFYSLFGGVIYLAYKNDFFVPNTTIVLQIDPAAQVPVSEQMMEAVVATLHERSDTMQYFRAKISISGENRDRIKVTLPKDIDYQEYIDQVTSIGLIEFVDFGSEPLPDGTLIRTDYEHPGLDGGEGPVHHTLMTNMEVSNVEISMIEEGLGMFFETTVEGTEILKTHTSNHIGQFMALVLDKRVITSPRIDAPIVEGEGLIDGWTFSEDEIYRYGALLGTKPLPAPLVVEQVIP